MHAEDRMTENYEEEEDFTFIFYLWAPAKPPSLLSVYCFKWKKKRRYIQDKKKNECNDIVANSNVWKTQVHAHISGPDFRLD